jgi:hypothetical protein
MAASDADFQKPSTQHDGECRREDQAVSKEMHGLPGCEPNHHLS